MEFEWDENKRLEVARKHGVDLLVAALIFRGETVSRVDNRRDYGEVRFIATGLVNGTCFVVVHTEREGVTRLISAWKVADVSKPDIRRASLDELQEMMDEGKLLTNLPDAPGEELPEEFWDDAVVMPPRTVLTSVRLNLEPEVFAFFKAQGKGHITRMQNVLKAYVKAHSK